MLTLNSTLNYRLTLMRGPLYEITIAQEDQELVRVFDLSPEKPDIADRNLKCISLLLLLHTMTSEVDFLDISVRFLASTSY